MSFPISHCHFPVQALSRTLAEKKLRTLKNIMTAPLRFTDRVLYVFYISFASIRPVNRPRRRGIASSVSGLKSPRLRVEFRDESTCNTYISRVYIRMYASSLLPDTDLPGFFPLLSPSLSLSPPISYISRATKVESPAVRIDDSAGREAAVVVIVVVVGSGTGTRRYLSPRFII